MAAELKPYRAYKDSGVGWLGDVPEHWVVRRIKTLFREREARSGDGTGLLLSLTRARGLVPQSEASNRIAGADDLTNYKACRPGDLVMNRMQAWSGMFAVSPLAGLVSPDYSVFEAIEPCETEHFAHLFRTSVTVDQFAKASKGIGSGFNRLYTPDFGAVPIVIPPLPEQVAIVRFLDHADRHIRRYIRAKQKLTGLLEESRTVLINHAVSRGLEPNADTGSTRSHMVPATPRDWTLRRMGSLLQRVRRPITVRQDRQYREIGIRSWGKGIFHKDPVAGAVLGEKSVFRIEPGDLVLNIVFAWEGAVAVVSEDETGMIASHRFPTFRPSPDVDVDYLLMVFQSDQGRRILEVNSPGAAGRNKTLRVGRFLDEEMPLPTLGDQRAIVAAFRACEQQLADCVAGMRQAVTTLEEYRACLIADVVTGKLDIREVSARLAEVVPLGVEGEADSVEGDIGSERPGWRRGAEAAGAEPDIGDAEQADAAAGELIVEGK